MALKWCHQSKYESDVNLQINNSLTRFIDKKRRVNISYVKPLFDKLKVNILIRCKANLNPYYKKVVEGGYHVDCEHGWTAVYYVNTNNGYTKFKKGKKITSKENRCVIFPSVIEHTGTTTSNEPFRCVINTNFSV